MALCLLSNILLLHIPHASKVCNLNRMFVFASECLFKLSRSEHNDRLFADEAALPPATLDPQRREASWLVPEGLQVAGVAVQEGITVVIDTGPLGWRGIVRLPKAGEPVDTARDKRTLHETWVLRESDYLRAALFPGR